jgi:hypothetical protein
MIATILSKLSSQRVRVEERRERGERRNIVSRQSGGRERERVRAREREREGGSGIKTEPEAEAHWHQEREREDEREREIGREKQSEGRELGVAGALGELLRPFGPHLLL